MTSFRPLRQARRVTLTPNPSHVRDADIRARILAEAEAEVVAEIRRIEWDNPEVWVCLGADQQPVRWPIVHMHDKHLWETVIWLCTNAVFIFRVQELVTPRSLPAALAAARWLKTQPVVQSLVRESVGRGLTFPQHVFLYIRDHLAPNDAPAPLPEEPWRSTADPSQLVMMQEIQQQYQAEKNAQNFVDTFGKPARTIQLD